MFNFTDLKAKLALLQTIVIATFDSTKQGLEWLYNRINAVRSELLAKIGVAKNEAIADANAYTNLKVGNEVSERNAAISTAVNGVNATINQAMTTEVSDRNAAIGTSKAQSDAYADSKSAATLSQANAYSDGIGTAAEQARAALQTAVNNRLSILESGNFGSWDDFGVLTLTSADGSTPTASVNDLFAATMAAEGKTIKPNAGYILMLEGDVEVEKSIAFVRANGTTATVTASAGEQFVIKTDENGAVVSARYVANPFMEAKMAVDAHLTEMQTGINETITLLTTNNADLAVIKNAIQTMVATWQGLPNQ
jgi:hypothetical protein